MDLKSIPDISEKMLIQELKILVDSNLATRKSCGATRAESGRRPTPRA
jgi:DNA-binding HxlR family transcriptional regulator